LALPARPRAALVIFVLHLATLTLLVLWILARSNLTSMWALNLGSFRQEGDRVMALFLGFSAAMLRVSGFESSANYVEKQRPGVFRA
jgi:hypothetical protein